jgi:hypothetical protein
MSIIAGLINYYQWKDYTGDFSFAWTFTYLFEIAAGAWSLTIWVVRDKVADFAQKNMWAFVLLMDSWVHVATSLLSMLFINYSQRKVKTMAYGPNTSRSNRLPHGFFENLYAKLEESGDVLASANDGMVGQLEGNKDWTGSADMYGYAPAYLPGDTFTFTGFYCTIISVRLQDTTIPRIVYQMFI